MNVAGIIFSNIHDKNIPELTRQRTIASVPFGCRYRLIDFALSNMVNAGITNISVIAHYNYHSLMDHIGSGKDWDLARRSGGIRILPPFITAYANSSNGLYTSRLEALKSISHSINQIKEEYVVISDCDGIWNFDLQDMISVHIDMGADITMAVKRTHLDVEQSKRAVVLKSDSNGNLTDVLVCPNGYEGIADASINVWVVNTAYLKSFVADAIAHGYNSFSYDILKRNLVKDAFKIYRYDGYYSGISSMAEYFARNMELLEIGALNEVFNLPERQIYTKVRNSAPTRYLEGAEVKNSMLADGCTVEGRVENSIIFRGVKIGKGAVVKNSILFQDTYVAENCYLNCVITDKNVVVRDGVNLSGCPSLPYYIEKGKGI